MTQHTHGAHAIRALPPVPLTEPRPGDLPGWTGEPIPAPDPRTAVHRTIAPPPAATAPPVVKESLTAATTRPSWGTAIALALLCATLSGALATFAAMPTGDTHHVAVRTVTR